MSCYAVIYVFGYNNILKQVSILKLDNLWGLLFLICDWVATLLFMLFLVSIFYEILYSLLGLIKINIKKIRKIINFVIIPAFILFNGYIFYKLRIIIGAFLICVLIWKFFDQKKYLIFNEYYLLLTKLIVVILYLNKPLFGV